MLKWDKKKDDVGVELKKLVFKKKDLYWIGMWASNLIYKYQDEKSVFIYRILSQLEFLCEGKSFEISYEELVKLADDMILEKEIKLK